MRLAIHRHLNAAPEGRGADRSRRIAFTIIELLVVIAIIGALAAISLPAIKGINQSHTVNNASQQLMDDLAQARQHAINNRSVVHVVFVSGDVTNMTFTVANDLAKRLMTGPFTMYAIYAERTIGDQPGQWRPRYLSKWKSLPDGVFVSLKEFVNISPKDWNSVIDPMNRPFLKNTRTSFPFPTLANTPIKMPHVAFNPNGSLFFEDENGNRFSSRDEIIELSRGSILAVRDETTGNLISFDVRESPPNNGVDNFNRIRIDGLTGRCSVERPQL